MKLKEDWGIVLIVSGLIANVIGLMNLPYDIGTDHWQLYGYSSVERAIAQVYMLLSLWVAVLFGTLPLRFAAYIIWGETSRDTERTEWIIFSTHISISVVLMYITLNSEIFFTSGLFLAASTVFIYVGYIASMLKKKFDDNR